MMAPDAKLPNEVVAALAQMGFDPGARDDAICVAQVVYEAEHRLIQRLGASAFQKLRRLFLDNISSALADYARVVSSSEGDFVVAADRDRASLPVFLDRAFAIAEEPLSESLMPACRILNASEPASVP
jgi:hypothetical protein